MPPYEPAADRRGRTGSTSNERQLQVQPRNALCAIDPQRMKASLTGTGHELQMALLPHTSCASPRRASTTRSDSSPSTSAVTLG